jgi:YggT family protein
LISFFFNFVYYLTWTLIVAIIIRSIMSWLPVSRESPFVTVVYQVTEPILAPLRRVVPTFGMMDFTPLVAILVLNMIQAFVDSLRMPLP